MVTPVATVMNQKGGVGKSTLCNLFAQFFSLVRGLRVLMADLDPQGNTSSRFVAMDTGDTEVGMIPPVHPDTGMRHSVADIFYEDRNPWPYATWINKDTTGGRGTLDVLVADRREFEAINAEFAGSGPKARRAWQRIADLLHHESVQKDYDLVIVDTNPLLTPITRCALHAADIVVVPFSPTKNDIDGIDWVSNLIASEYYQRPNNSRFDWVFLPNCVKANARTHKFYIQEIPKLIDKQYLAPREVWLPSRQKIQEMQEIFLNPKSIFDLRPSELARKDVVKTMLYFEKRIFGKYLGSRKV